jgi:hypothetical protein
MNKNMVSECFTDFGIVYNLAEKAALYRMFCAIEYKTTVMKRILTLFIAMSMYPVANCQDIDRTLILKDPSPALPLKGREKVCRGFQTRSIGRGTKESFKTETASIMCTRNIKYFLIRPLVKGLPPLQGEGRGGVSYRQTMAF